MTSTSKTKSSVLGRIASNLNHHRLGDLLTTKGIISADQLENALRAQRQTGDALGKVLREQGLITTGTLRTTLIQQLAWRAMAAACVFVVGFSTMGFSTTSARATSATLEGSKISKRSTPEKDGDVVQASLDRKSPVSKRAVTPQLFGSNETRSADISPFTKFTAVMARLNDKSAPMPAALASLAGASDADKIEGVNTYYNKIRYIEDQNNYGTSDYWQTPAEFASKGGDCEDYVIAKYSALKKLGFTEDKLRFVILQDTWKGIPHAILVVYTDDGAKFLDNQYKTVKNVDGFTRYRPIYSINKTGWWRHVS